jgi:hypothetical protein
MMLSTLRKMLDTVDTMEELQAMLEEVNVTATEDDEPVDGHTLHAALQLIASQRYSDIVGFTISVRYRDQLRSGGVSWMAAIGGAGSSVLHCLLAQLQVMLEVSEKEDGASTKSQVH